VGDEFPLGALLEPAAGVDIGPLAQRVMLDAARANRTVRVNVIVFIVFSSEDQPPSSAFTTTMAAREKHFTSRWKHPLKGSVAICCDDCDMTATGGGMKRLSCRSKKYTFGGSPAVASPGTAQRFTPVGEPMALSSMSL